MSVVLDRHRPTLAEAAASWPRALRRALLALAVLVALALAAVAVWPEDRGIVVVRERAPQFNFARPAGLKPVAPVRDQLLRLERVTRSGRLAHAFAVAPLALPPYRGETAGILPIAADAEIARLRARHPGFTLVQEGRARLNKVPGYTILFKAREDGRPLYGRTVLLPEPVPGTRGGVRLELLATPAGGVRKAADAGVVGASKPPLRSFRYGTEGP